MLNARNETTELQQFQTPEIYRALTEFKRLRLRVLPILIGIASLIAVIDPEPWRRYVLLFSIVVLIAITIIQFIRGVGAERALSEIQITGFFLISFQLILAFCTGALESPIMPVIPVVGLVMGLLVGRRVALLFFILIPLVTVWTFAIGELWGVLPNVNLEVFGGGVRAGHNDALLWTAASIFTVLIIATSIIGTFLRSLFDAMIIRAIESRDHSLQTHKEQIQEMNALSGEIAHELKNPLTSIKGLAGLIAKDVPTGKASQRMEVLRQEVDRMQGIVDEFLTFSRPLVPLNKTPTDIAQLCKDVLILHEGAAQRNQIRTSLINDRRDPISVDCDPRKITQVLINLFQNALEAEKAGGQIQVRVGHTAKNQVSIEVQDTGPGIDSSLAEKIFSAGLTTKDTGSGLGLTIARGIAEQHGGTLILKNGPQGGCQATLTLPLTEKSNDN